MSYWFDSYGKCSRDFIDGVIAGITAFAVWKDGKQYVGVLEKPLVDVLRDVEEQLGGDDG